MLIHVNSIKHQEKLHLVFIGGFRDVRYSLAVMNKDNSCQDSITE